MESMPEGQNAPNYWITPVKEADNLSSVEVVIDLVSKDKIFALRENTLGQKVIKPGDRICFYATGVGVVADAVVDSEPELGEHPEIDEDFPWLIRLRDARLYPDNPVVITPALRRKLDMFRGKDPDKGWGWFVQTLRKITEHDFKLLTGRIQ